MLALGLRKWLGRENFACTFCDGVIPGDDVNAGRSMVLLSQRYCERCLEEAVMRGRFETPAPRVEGMAPFPSARTPVEEAGSTDADGSFGSDARTAAIPTARDRDERAHERFVPPREADLSIWSCGWAGRLVGDLVKHWLDVSEGGVRAIVSGQVEKRDVLAARIGYRPYRQTFDVALSARHVMESCKYPGSFVVGFAFVKPPAALKVCIRNVMCGHPALPERALRKLRTRAEAEKSAAVPVQPTPLPAGVAPASTGR